MDNFEEVLPKMLKIQLFSGFSSENEADKAILQKVYKKMKVQEYKKGEMIIKESDFGEDFYILYKGKVRVQRKTFSGDTLALADLDAEDNVFFGEGALICNDPRSATVKAITDCKTIVLNSDDFFALCDEEPVLGYRVLLQLARRMSKTIVETNSDKATLYEALFNEIQENN